MYSRIKEKAKMNAEMNAEIVNDLKIINRDYLMTPRGKEDL